MRIWMIAAVAALGLGSLAAENVAPTKSELEEMYGKAFREFDANNFPQALKELDAIDARQPDLAASKNLRGVILMRQGIYDKAEAALLEATRLDPKFWNARFNLAEIPFLKKDWAAARSRFEELFSSSESDLASEASQLIQYKILLTYLLEGKENMVDSIMAKLELSRDTPAVDYVKAAVALQNKNQKEAKDWMTVAEKNFSPQLNKLFAESLYEVGWLERPAGEARASLPLTTAVERAEKGKALARSKFEQAQQALRQRDFATARKVVDESDQAQPNQPATLNLRGEILMEQKEFGEAETAFKKAAKLDPKFREAQYNLAQIPFKKKEYAKARERFETLLARTPGGDKNQAAELMKFKIYMTLLLEGKESRAQAMMEQFQFTGDTPALYYAQAAWEFKHNNPEKAADWTASATKIYSPALNSVFADAFYDVGWMQAPEPAAPEPALDAGSAIAAQAEGSPAVEPSPIPDAVAAANKQAETSKGESPATSALVTNPPTTDTQTTSVGETALEPAAGETGTRTEETPGAAVSESSSVGSITATASPAEVATAESAPAGQSAQAAATETKPSEAPVLPTTVTGSTSQTGIAGLSRQTWLFGGLLLAGIFAVAWVVVPTLRRRYAFNVPGYPESDSMATSPKRGFARVGKEVTPGNGFLGGPRQVSLRLTASKPSLRHTALPLAKASRSFDGVADFAAKEGQLPAYQNAELRKLTPITEPFSESESVGPVLDYSGGTLRHPEPESPSFTEPDFDSGVGPVIEQTAETFQPSVPEASEMVDISPVSNLSEPFAAPPEEPIEIPGAADEVDVPAVATLTPTEPEIVAIEPEYTPPSEDAVTSVQSPLAEADTAPTPDIQEAISAEPEFPQTTTPVTMPEPTQIPPAPITKPPVAPVSKPPAAAPAAAKPQPVATAQTSVQLTFSFEIAAMQLTPSFKMGSLNVRPISKIVTMRLAPSQQPQPGMNLQVSFEIAKIQPLGSALGTIRMVPSQQRPPVSGSSSVAVAGLQLVSNSEAAPVQLTPSQPGQATVFVTVPCQITTIEFAPSLEIASVVLNSNSKQVRLQLPGAGLNPREGAPTFEITNLQLGDSGDIAMMHLNLVGSGSKQS